MSWSVSFIGKPENVAIALEEEKEKMDEQTRKEYEGALPHMVGLVKQNFSNIPVVKIEASGHGFGEGESEHRECRCHVEPFYTQLV